MFLTLVHDKTQRHEGEQAYVKFLLHTGHVSTVLWAGVYMDFSTRLMGCSIGGTFDRNGLKNTLTAGYFR